MNSEITPLLLFPGCHKPNVSVGALRAMILVSDRTQGAPGSLEAWSCRDCSQDHSVTQKTAVTIDLTLDSDSDDGIRVIEQPQRVKRENREVVQERESSIVAAASTSRPAFEFYAPPPYLDTLIKSRESTAKAYLTSLFPPNHTRNDYNALFDPNANQMDNPFSQWIRPEPVRTFPIPKTQRHGRKSPAKHAPSPSTSQLQETGWLSWGDS
jgi:hypothetical protein